MDNNTDIKVDDLVEELGTDSGLWRVTALYRESSIFKRKAFARLSLVDRPSVVAHCDTERLRRV